MSYFVSSEKSDHKALNRFAWNIVTDPSSTKKERQLAGEAARRADQKAPGRPEILDTLANVYFLQGSIDEAIELQTEAIEKFDLERTKDREDDLSVLSEEAYEKQVQSLREVYISQLARFEYALFLRDGPPPGAWKIALSFETVSESKTPRIRVRLDKPYLKGIQIHAAVVQGTLLTGHLAITLPPSDKTEFFHEFQEGPVVSWSKSSRLDIVLVQEKDVSKGHWIATKYAAEVARLPAKPIQ